jgi:hypothetical protein
MDQDWTSITQKPPECALIIYYQPFADYIITAERDVEELKRHYPRITHWKVFTTPPPPLHPLPNNESIY